MKTLTKIFFIIYIIGMLYLVFMPGVIHHYNPYLPEQYVDIIYQHTIVAYFKKNWLLHILYLP